jgi:hypothetical protein
MRVTFRKNVDALIKSQCYHPFDAQVAVFPVTLAHFAAIIYKIITLAPGNVNTAGDRGSACTYRLGQLF